jgi:hypothetical protein
MWANVYRPLPHLAWHGSYVRGARPDMEREAFDLMQSILGRGWRCESSGSGLALQHLCET